MLSITLVPLHLKARRLRKEFSSITYLQQRQIRHNPMKPKSKQSSFAQLSASTYTVRPATHAHERNATWDGLRGRAAASPSSTPVNVRHRIRSSRSLSERVVCPISEISIDSLLRQSSTVEVTVDSLTRLVKLARLTARVSCIDKPPLSSSTEVSALDLPLAAKLSESVLEDLGDASSDGLLAEWLADQRSTYHEHHGAAPSKRRRRASTPIEKALKPSPKDMCASTQIPRARKTFSVMSFLGSDRTRRKPSKDSKPKKSISKRLKSFAKGAKTAIAALKGRKPETSMKRIRSRRTMVWV